VNIEGFAARADIVGRRVRISWCFVPQPGETLADIPPVTLRRKQRDYAYPPPASPDPYLVYATQLFPPVPVPGALTVTDLDGWQKIIGGERFVFEPISVAIATGGRFVEILRCTTVNIYDLNGIGLRRRVDIIDVGPLPGALLANEVYYYQLFGQALPASGDAAAPYRDTAMVTDSYGQNRALYNALPEIYRVHDVITGPTVPGVGSVPELAPNFGQLRRFLDPFGIALDSLRGTAEGLRGLHDIDRVDAKFLGTIAQWIGWDLSVDIDIPLQRNEIKAASRLYKLVGTLPGLRALVTQYTGWSTQVAEFTQNIALSNQPPKRNLFAITPYAATGTGWLGVDDASDVLGFGAANQSSAGTAGTAATLTGTTQAPFALRPGMVLRVAVDGLPPAAIRFGVQDFADIATAQAAEIAAAINKVLNGVTAAAAGAQLVLASDTVGPLSLLQIVPAPQSLVSLEGAPAGRLSAGNDALGRLRLFYEAWETPTQPAPGITQSTGPSAADTGNFVLRQVHTKTFADGAWRNAQPVYPSRVTPQADPAGLVLPDGSLWLAWLDNPLSGAATLRWTTGAAQPALPASIAGQAAEPFALTAGAILTLTGSFPGTDIFTVQAAGFANLASATAAELAAAMNAQFTQVTASRAPNGSIVLATKALGDMARLAVDLAQSTTARILGLAGGAAGATGSWDDTIAWGPPLHAGPVGGGNLAELTAANDPAGGVRLAWAANRRGAWAIESAHWNNRVLAGTANGAYQQTGAAAWASIPGLPSTDIRAIVLDATGTAWIASAAGVSLLDPGGAIVPLAATLPSPDVRALALGPDGTAYIGTGAGVAICPPGGPVTTLDAAGGLPSNDVRALALGADLSLWVATAAGAAQCSATGVKQTYTTANLLPGNLVQGVAVDGAGTVYLATSAGLLILPPGGPPATVDATSGLAASDSRAVAASPDGSLWVATAAGVSQRSPAGAWQGFGTANGMPSNDTLSLAIGPDGTAWVGTAQGISTIAPDGTIANPDIAGGILPNPAGRAVQTGWSSVLVLANEGANREPALAADASQRLWLVWSQRAGPATGQDSFSLQARIFTPATLSWAPPVPLTAPPPGGRATDRTPGLQMLPAAMRVYFASDRAGGFSLWSADVTLAGAPGPLAPLPGQSSSQLSPCPAAIGPATWLLFRSDANVALAQTAAPREVIAPPPSTRVSDNGTVRRFAGSLAADLSDLTRLSLRGGFGDRLCYTPNRPDGAGTLLDTEYYTRGTVGLYVSAAAPAATLTEAEAGRLAEILSRFLPINLRALVMLVQSPVVELVYPNAGGPTDSYADVYPFVSAYGTITDSAAAAMPDLSVLLANAAADVSANPADLTTLRRRAWFPALQ
jgi:phage tail-like protein